MTAASDGPGPGQPVAALRRALAAGTLSSAELTAGYLARIDRLNPRLRAVITVSPHAADEARASDQARRRRAPAGPLAGIPVLVKDNIAVRGMPATAGSPALSGAESGDAFCVGRLRQAGAVILGKANLSEWANFRSTASTSGWSTLGGQAVNPHGPGRNPSGLEFRLGASRSRPGWRRSRSAPRPTAPSSARPAPAGSSASSPPSAWSAGTGIVPISPPQDTAGPMARTVADAAALLSVLPRPTRPTRRARAARRPARRLHRLPGRRGAARRPDRRLAGRLPRRRPGHRARCWTGRWRRCAAWAPTLVGPGGTARRRRDQRSEFTALLHEFKQDLNAYLGGLPGEHPRSLWPS